MSQDMDVAGKLVMGAMILALLIVGCIIVVLGLTLGYEIATDHTQETVTAILGLMLFMVLSYITGEVFESLDGDE